MVTVLGMSLVVSSQEPGRESTVVVEKISVQQFIEEYFTALQANDLERIVRLIANNPNIANQVHHQLKLLGEGSEKEAEQLRTFIEPFGTFHARDFTEVAEKIAIQLFLEDFVAELQSGNDERIYQLTASNLHTAAQVYQWLILLGEGEGEKAVFSRELAAILGEILTYARPHPDLDGLREEGLKAAYASDYLGALEKWYTGLYWARTLNDKRYASQFLANIGNVYNLAGQYQQALDTYRQAVMIHRELDDKSGEGIDLANIGVVYAHLGQYQRALDYYDQALTIHRDIGDKQGAVAVLTNIGMVYQGLGEYQEAYMAFQESVEINEVLGLTDNLWRAQGDLASVEVYLNQIESAITHYEQALDNIEALYTGLTGEERTLSFMLGRQRIYDELITLLQTLHQARPGKGYDCKALEIFERKQGLAFLEEMNKNGISSLTGLPESLIQPPTLFELQNLVLHPEELLLVYGVMQDQTLLWVVGQQDFILLTLNITEEELEKQIEDFRAAPEAITAAIENGEQPEVLRLASESLAQMTQTGYALYQQLFPASVLPLVEHAHTLYIVPTGFLYELPFEALVSESPKTGKLPRYLVQDHPITYLSSASLMKILRDAQIRHEQAARYTLLALANPGYVNDALVATADQPETQGDAAPAANSNAVVLSCPDPEGSLTIADAFELQPAAEIVVLPSCNSGPGKHARGEDMMGLTRALMYSGTRAVSVPLWSVDTTASHEIHTRFFHYLNAGANLADALRQAKLDVLAEAEEDKNLAHFKHPFFWAPFVVFGDGGNGRGE